MSMTLNKAIATLAGAAVIKDASAVVEAWEVIKTLKETRQPHGAHDPYAVIENKPWPDGVVPRYERSYRIAALSSELLPDGTKLYTHPAASAAVPQGMVTDAHCRVVLGKLFPAGYADEWIPTMRSALEDIYGTLGAMADRAKGGA